MSTVFGVEQETEMQKRLVEANVGYFCVNITDPFCSVDTWQVCKQFYAKGPLTYKADKFLFVVMCLEWITNVKDVIQVIDRLYIWNVNILELTESGRWAVTEEWFHLLNGNHQGAVLCFTLLIYAKNLWFSRRGQRRSRETS